MTEKRASSERLPDEVAAEQMLDDALENAEREAALRWLRQTSSRNRKERNASARTRSRRNACGP